MSVLEQVLGEVETFEGDAAGQFEALARSIHAGEKPDTSHVVNVLSAAKKTKSDLADLVRTFASRDQVRADMRELVQLHERNREILAEIERHNAELEQAVERHRRATAPLQNERASNNGRIPQLSGGDNKLFQTCANEALVSAHRSTMFLFQQQGQKCRALHDKLERVQANVGGHDYRHFESTRKQVDGRIKAIQAELAEAREEQSQLQAETVRLADAMREW